MTRPMTVTITAAMITAATPVTTPANKTTTELK